MSTLTSATPASDSFNIEGMRSPWLVEAGFKWLFDQPQGWMGVLRKALPFFRVPRFYTIVTRFAHVQEVLAREEVFQVPFAARMFHLMAGPKFVLAMQDGDEYRLQRREIMQAFRLEDVAARIAPRSAGLAAQIVEQSGGRIDAVEELLTRVPTILCREYYGLNVQDPKLFAQWTLAVSGYVFGSPWGKRDRHTATAQTAANCLGALIDESIRNARRAGDRSTTIVARLVGMQEKGNGHPSDEMIRTELFGMIVGFVPTNTIASGNILEMLLRRGDFMEAAQAAARADDDERLWRCLFEALRFKPINSGLFRECVKDHTIGAGGPRGKRIRPGTRLLVSTQSAMFDGRWVVEPDTFNPDRPKHEYMLFGYGLHWCIGAFLAAAQITQTFKPLLKKHGLVRAQDGDGGRLQTIGVMPLHLRVQFRA
jgi:cytochrome P450